MPSSLRIARILHESPGLTEARIARRLGPACDRQMLGVLLRANKNAFRCDGVEPPRWRVTPERAALMSTYASEAGNAHAPMPFLNRVQSSRAPVAVSFPNHGVYVFDSRLQVDDVDAVAVWFAGPPGRILILTRSAFEAGVHEPVMNDARRRELLSGYGDWFWLANRSPAVATVQASLRALGGRDGGDATERPEAEDTAANEAFGSMSENETFGSIGENETFGSMGENETFGSMGENETFGSMGENETFGSMGENETFGSMDEIDAGRIRVAG